MQLKVFLGILALIILGFVGFLTYQNYIIPKEAGEKVKPINIILPKKEVMGFLPYWLAGKGLTDYSKYITMLSYFSLTADSDGTIQKYTNPGESEPGYLALTSGKMDSFLNIAKEKGVDLSLLIFSYDDDNISQMINDPEQSAKNLLSEVSPIMENYGFTDLNLDIEQVSDASPEARLKFTQFVKSVRENLNPKIVKTVSIDISASAFVKDTNLCDPKALAPLVDKVVLMAYDYHYMGSMVTGPVAPIDGAGTVSELDTRVIINQALKIMPAKKLILGIPLYGYEWETIGDTPRSAVVPGSGMTISNARAEELLQTCASCSAEFDNIDKENHIIYKDEQTGTYHQVFYPDKKAIQYKVDLANQYNLGGIAMWALGYEGKTILEPLAGYHN
jgi:spore germination protein YaaH